MFPPRNQWENQKLSDALGGHLDWSNKTASPFISAYANWRNAIKSAVERVDQGKRRVFIVAINVEGCKNLWYRHVPKLAKEVGHRLKPQALNDLQDELMFFEQIPGEAIEWKLPV